MLQILEANRDMTLKGEVENNHGKRKTGRAFVSKSKGAAKQDNNK